MIKNEYTVTWKLYREWLMENKTKGVKLAFLVFWSFMAIVLFVMSFFGDLSWFYLLMSVFCVYRAFFRDYIAARKQYAQLAKIYGCESWLRTITISDTDIMLEEGNSSIQCQCADVVRVTEKGDKIWLVMNSNTVIRLYKSAFTEGSWEECKELFQKKNYE